MNGISKNETRFFQQKKPNKQKTITITTKNKTDKFQHIFSRSRTYTSGGRIYPNQHYKIYSKYLLAIWTIFNITDFLFEAKIM